MRAAMNSASYSPRRRPSVLTVSDGGRTATIMVGPIRSPVHLELIHRERFYHVPVTAIGAARTAVGFIAFYEGASRFSRGAGVIREYAEVLRVSTVPRRDLPGLTWPGRGGAETLYYRFDLGPIVSLPRPIANPDRLRVVFRFPDVERFRASATVRELGASHPKTTKRATRVSAE
jgi:hypothetical protein